MRRRTWIAVIIAGISFWLIIPLYRIRLLFNRLRVSPGPDGHSIETAAHIAEFIYPADAAPGALALNIHRFFTEQFVTLYYYRHGVSLQRLMKYVDTQARISGARDFLSAEKSVQDQILQRVTSGEDDETSQEIQRGFYALVDMTLEGCFSDPRHGGNCNKQAWRLLGGTIKEEWFDV